MGVRSLFTGVGGLRNFQQQLDIIGNNIANANTPGFKASRVTFQDLLSQTLRSATGGTAGGVGGTNPQQIGLGSTLGAIDTDTTQGSLLVTGRTLDLAIQGNGYFSVSDGETTYYTRAGAFNIDSDGYMVSSTSGYKARGYNATAGVLTTTVDEIQVPVGIVIDATPTTQVDMVGNLDAGAEQEGTVMETATFLATELTADDKDMEGLYANGNLDNYISGLANLTTTVSVTMTNGGSHTYTYTSSADPTAGSRQFNSIADLAAELDLDYGSGGTDFAGVSVDATGRIELLNSTGAVTVSVSSNNSSLNAALNPMTASYILNGDGYSDEFSHRAEEADLVTNLRNGAGASLALVATDVININGDVGGTAVSAGSLTIGAGTTLGDLCNQIQTTFGITNQADNVKMSSLGKLQIYGDGGMNYAITNMNITTTPARANFDAIFDDTVGNWSTTQSAADNHVMSFIAYDSIGTAHTVTFRLNIRDPAGGSNQWVWDVESEETETGTADSIPNSTGIATFNADGSLLAFSPTTIIIDPQGGIGENIEIVLGAGTTNQTDGLVCYDSASSARLLNADGYTSGELEAIAINESGLITGNFTNGQNQALGQLVLATFDNAAGLQKVGDNVYIETLNSGSPTEAAPQTGGRGSIIPSALEGSNVDLAFEFVNLITAQRGYQTNARMITTSDSMLQELVNLVR